MTRRSIRLIRILTLMFAASACSSSPTGPDSALLAETSGSAFVLQGEWAEVPFVLTNISKAKTFRVAACGGRVMTQIERKRGRSWVQESSARCPAVLSSVPLAMGPAGRMEAATAIRSTGVFRIRISATRDDGTSPPRSVLSNQFTVYD